MKYKYVILPNVSDDYLIRVLIIDILFSTWIVDQTVLCPQSLMADMILSFLHRQDINTHERSLYSPSGFRQAYMLISILTSLPPFSLPCLHSSYELPNISSNTHHCNIASCDLIVVQEQSLAHSPEVEARLHRLT